MASVPRCPTIVPRLFKIMGQRKPALLLLFLLSVPSVPLKLINKKSR